MSITQGLVAVAALLAANAFFVATEFGLVTIDRARIEAAANDGNPGARRVHSLLRRLTHHLSGAQFGITVSAILLGFVAEPTMARIMTGGHGPTGTSVVLAVVAATVLHLVIGEQVPKYLALASPERVVRFLAPAIGFYGLVSRPVVAVLNGSANVVVRRLGLEPRRELKTVRSLDELSELIQTSAGKTLDSADARLLTRSLRLVDKTAADVLVPRLDVHALEVDATGAALLERSVRTGHSRFPVIEGDLDRVVGVVHVKSLLRLEPTDRALAPIRELMMPALAIPETRSLDALLDDMRRERSPMAVVVDEHGGTAGLITEEDVLEEVVGEIVDDVDLEPLVNLDRGRDQSVLSAGLTLDELREKTGLELPEGPYETLAGFVLFRLGRLPEPSATVHYKGWSIEVLAMDGRRLAVVRIKEPPGWDFLVAPLEDGEF